MHELVDVELLSSLLPSVDVELLVELDALSVDVELLVDVPDDVELLVELLVDDVAGELVDVELLPELDEPPASGAELGPHATRFASKAAATTSATSARNTSSPRRSTRCIRRSVSSSSNIG